MYHGDGQSACIKCSFCGEYIRPEEMSKECPLKGRAPTRESVTDSSKSSVQHLPKGL